MDVQTFRNDPRRAFLDRIPINHRPVVASVFYEAAQTVSSPEELVAVVTEKAQAALGQSLPHSDHPLTPVWMLFLAKLQLHAGEAAGFAAFALEYSRLPVAERRHIQAMKGAALRARRSSAPLSDEGVSRGGAER